MELADIFVVNKADLPGAEKTAAEVEAMLDLSSFANGWRPPVVSTVSIHDIGIEHLWSMVEKHRQFQEEKGLTREGHQVRLEQEVLEIVEFELAELINRVVKEDDEVREIIKQVMDKELDPYSGALKIIKSDKWKHSQKE
jgi:LAO/AO transport system kinase